MKKIIALILTMGLIVTALVGCGSNNTADEGTEVTAAEAMVSQTYKYDDADAYIHVSMNHTYQMSGADMEPNEKVTFWNYLEGTEDTIVLYNEFGGEEMTLAASDNEAAVITDDNGDTLTACNKPMNGIYKCGMDANFLDGDQLTLTTNLTQYLSDAEVQALEAGSEINVTDMDFLGTTVEKIEKDSETSYRINDQFTLYFDEQAGVWVFGGDAQLGEQIGVATITADTKFEANSAGDFATLEECLKNVDGIQAAVEVKDGVVVSIAVIVVE